MPKIEELIPPTILQEIQEKLRGQAKKKLKKPKKKLKAVGRITNIMKENK